MSAPSAVEWFTPPAEQLADPLFGTLPTWRLPDETPLYLEAVRDLGVPGLDEPARPAQIVRGDVLDPAVDAPPTVALRLVASAPSVPAAAAPAPRRQPKRRPRAARKAS